MHSWPGLLSRQIDLAERDSLTAQISALTQPAPTNWVLARVAALLTAYYAADVPSQIVSIEAEDWADALKDYPDWAITKAVRWWKGDANPDRRKRPLQGDIVARVKFEMGAIAVARMAIERFDQGRPVWKPDEPRKPIDPVERQRIAAEIMRAAELTPKKMGTP